MQGNHDPSPLAQPGERSAPRFDPHDGDRTSLAELAELASKRLDAVSASLRTLWAVRKDKAQLAVRRRMQSILLGAAAALAGGAAIIHAVVLFVRGLAAGLGQLFDGRSWLGELAAGALVLALLAGGLTLGIRRSNRVQLRKQQAKYERLHRKHRSEARKHRSEATPGSSN